MRGGCAAVAGAQYAAGGGVGEVIERRKDTGDDRQWEKDKVTNSKLEVRSRQCY